MDSLKVIYHVRGDAESIAERARAIAIEQSVEMPLAAIDDATVRSEIVGRVEAIEPKAAGVFEVRIALATATVGRDAGQLLNMLFGNTSIHDDVTLHDVELPAGLVKHFGGPRHGLHDLRQRAGAGARALTCSALKPQGLPAEKLADLARRFAQGGIDYIKDDHSLADQAYSPFAERVAAEEDADYEDVGGVGGTLAGNALSAAAIRATLGEVLTDEAFDRMAGVAERLADGIDTVVSAAELPWHVARLGARAEYRFSPSPPRNGGESARLGDPELEEYLHLQAHNRGVLLTPFHNMALVCPATTASDVDRHTEVLAEAMAGLA